MPSSTIDVDDILSQLTLKEKVSLLSLDNFWHLTPLPRFNLPAVRLSDGPNGVRGTKFFNGSKSACFPSGTGLGSTFNLPLLEKTGELMSIEAEHKSAHVVLGPTCNIQRSPLGGRGFESFSEDPVLSGLASASVINGIQKSGKIAATIKHYACNDFEDDRFKVNCIVSERALREVYLLPYQLANKYSDPKCYMTALNTVNGVHVSQNNHLLNEILREEWGYTGMVMSDWTGIYSVKKALENGLDLECPGKPLFRKHDALLHRILAREIKMDVIDTRVKNILNLLKYAAESGIPENGPEDEDNNTAETSAFLKKLASEAIVLLKNEGDLLPLKKEENFAIIGPNAKTARIFGGGSASLNAYYFTNIYTSVSEKLNKKEIPYALGSDIELGLFDLGKVATSGSDIGFNVKVYDGPRGKEDRKLLDEMKAVDSSKLLLFDYMAPNCPEEIYYMDLEGDYTPQETGEYIFKEYCLGTLLVYIDDELFIDDKTKQELGVAAIGVASKGYSKSIKLEAGKKYKIRIEFGSGKTFTLGNHGIAGGLFSVGFKQVQEESYLINQAVDIAKQADKVVVCIGTSHDYETEGFDRSTMDLPGNQEQLVSEILKVNKNIILINLSGMPVALPWIDEIPAFVQGWFNGCESGNAIADVLFGDVNPSGKLPLTFPRQVEDNPAFLTSKSNQGECVYGEDVFVGYRYYEKTKREPLFPFGFGLSYTSFNLSDLKVSLVEDNLVATVNVNNTGKLDGQEVVQLYVSPPETTTAVERPIKELKGFTKIELKAGESKNVTIEVPYKYASSYFDADADKWHAEAGVYKVLVGNSSVGEFLKGEYTLKKDELWSGL